MWKSRRGFFDGIRFAFPNPDETPGYFPCGLRSRIVQRPVQFFAISTIVTGAKEFREIRKQLRCCNWTRLSISQSP